MLRTTLLLVIAAITAEHANGLRVRGLAVTEQNALDTDALAFTQVRKGQ